jgi:hypothetical protein
MENTKNVRIVMIFEIIGKPAEHLTASLEEIIKAIDAEKGVSVKSKNIKKPTELKDKPGFFTTFAEVEVEVEEILYIAILMFKYMPAHIDVVSPELIALTNNGWSDVLSELARRLHGYDEVARVLQMEKAILEKKLREVLDKKPSSNEKK